MGTAGLIADTGPIGGMRDVSETIQSFTYPLLHFDQKGRPDLFASCVFLEVDGSVYLVTAAHALDGLSTGLMTRGRTHLFDIRGRGGKAKGVNGEEFDIAALVIERHAAQENTLKVVAPNMLSTAVEVDNPQSRAFCGYPVSKNKQARALDRVTKRFTARCYTYFGFADFTADFREFDKSRDIHLGLHYGPGTDDTGRELTTPPSPKGVSGAGAWLVPDFKKPQDVFLEGIVIECHRNQFVFSTRIECVVSFIRDRVASSRPRREVKA
jgi:hypothetical protein